MNAHSIDCANGGDDELYGGDGLVDYLIGGSFNDTIEGQDGMDLAFGDHASLSFYETESHQLRHATTKDPSCAGGTDYIDLGSGDVSLLKALSGAQTFVIDWANTFG